MKLKPKNWDRNGYKFLLAKICMFILFLFAADFLVGAILSTLYRKQTSGWDYRTKYSIEDTKADILIFGASRAQQQYNPVYFENRLHQSCYNVGRDGQPLFYSYSVFRSVLERYNPKMIIFDFEKRLFVKSESSYDRISLLLPFYKNHPEMHSVLELRSPFEKLKLLSKTYPYNSLLFKLILGNLEGNKKDEDILGYVPLKGSLNEPLRTVDLSERYPIDTTKVNLFRILIEDCKKRNIKLYIVCPPYYFNSVGSDTSLVMGKEIAIKNNLTFFDFAKDSFFLKNPQLFDDTVHVNFTGSKLFTNRLIDSIILSRQYQQPPYIK